MIDVRVQQIRYESDNIVSIQLYPIHSKLLPSFNSGAHIDVHLPNGKVRQYSLISPLQDRRYYEIGVLNDPKSKGGSRYIHQMLKVGDQLTISEPRNLFELDDTDQKVLLFAGGIGITPILSMWSSLAIDQRKCELHYCTRQMTVPFLDRIDTFKIMNSDSQYMTYIGNKDSNGFNIVEILHHSAINTHIYVCGSLGFIQYIEDTALAMHWHKHFIHKECFKNSETILELDSTEEHFLEIVSTGHKIPLQQTDNIAEVLNEAGYTVPMSCEQGICGTCTLHYIEGELYHQDMILNEQEHMTLFTPCCSKIKSKKIVIDL
ncbi:PDR/VanB family oxidoreductase [Acinetobacter gerneri]|uniref:PDR/VanB family oxidoreductase n=1 Tax=Acinetobacter gerneri TaxID=202952 RepID=UPI0023F0343D|nr:PDR/VanB family oxidoreductase [Acinetobacter gerneri]MCH4245830.1 PDR/VanB family oxidoreductase [Acinetobacter gerneri]